MPKSFEHLITVLETLPVERCSMEFVKARLLNEAVKRQFNVETVETSTTFSGRVGKPGNTGRLHTTITWREQHSIRTVNL